MCRVCTDGNPRNMGEIIRISAVVKKIQFLHVFTFIAGCRDDAHLMLVLSPE